MAHNDVYRQCKALDDELVYRKDDKRWLLEFPIEVLQLCGGLGVDIGSTASKFVFIKSEDADVVANGKPGTMCCVHMKSFPNSEIFDASDQVKKQLHIIRPDPDQKVQLMSSGIGGHFFHNKLNEVFNVNMVNLSEFDSASSGFLLVAKHHSPRTLLYPFIEGSIETPIRKVAEHGIACHEAFKRDLTRVPVPGIDNAGVVPEWPNQFLEHSIDASKPLTESGMFPCLLVTLGSAFTYYRIDKEGSYRIVDLSSRGGRYFMSLASYMLGTEDFNEVIDLAELGENKNIDTFVDDVIDPGEDYYGLGSEIEWLILSMGKVLGKKRNDIKREDLARSLIVSVIMDMVHHVQLLALQMKVKHIFFSGSFMNRFLVRYLISAEMARRNAQFSLFNDVDCDLRYYFMKHGPYLTAFGCLAGKIHLTKKTLEEAKKKQKE